MNLVLSMTNNFLQSRIFQHFDLATQNQQSLFWLLQLLGWGAYFIVSILTLTLFYNELSFTYVAYNAHFTDRCVTYSDGTTLLVPSRTLLSHTSSMRTKPTPP